LSELRRSSWHSRALGAAALLALSLAAHPVPTLAGPTYTVASNADFPKSGASGTACQSTGPGNPCTLRAAIQTANLIGAGTTIDVPSNLGTYTLIPANGPLQLTVGATIEATGGASPRVDGASAVPIFISITTAPVTITGLTFQHGTGGGILAAGGGDLILNQVTVTGISGNPALFVVGSLTMSGGNVTQNLDGGVLAFGAATVTNSSITHNGQAGGLLAIGTLNMTGGSITDNQSTSDGGGLATLTTATVTGTSFARNSSSSVGGAITVTGTATFTDLKITDNQAGPGGGGVVVDGSAGPATATIRDSTLSGNSSQGDGGGIGAVLGTLTVSGSTLNGNSSISGAGGGIAAVQSTVALTNDTLTGNTAPNFTGGGIIQEAVGPASTRRKAPPKPAIGLAQSQLQAVRAVLATYKAPSSALPPAATTPARAPRATPDDVTLESVTIAGNSAGSGGGVSNSLGLAFSVHNSIVAGNTSSAANPDCLGPLTTAGFNLESATDCAFTGSGDKQRSNPQLAPLAANGGPSSTMALLPGSPAIDTGDPACPPPASDQRGVTRHQGPRCDIGAFEAVPVTVVSLPAPPITGHPADAQAAWLRVTALAGILAVMVLISLTTAVRS
jgi:parallel beta helix pectate lyase-like protein